MEDIKDNKNGKMKEPCTGEIYRHYKGGIYAVQSVARHSEMDEMLVIYKNLSDEKVWARPLAMWNETAETDGEAVARFSRIAGSLEELDGKKLFKTIEEIALLCEMYNPMFDECGISYCKKDTGEVIRLTANLAAYIDGDMEEDELEEDDNAGIEKAKQISENFGDYVKISVMDIADEYEIMSEFAYMHPRYSVKLEESLHGKGVYRSFKEVVFRLGLENQWYAYRDMKLRKAIREWCDGNGVNWQKSFQ